MGESPLRRGHLKSMQFARVARLALIAGMAGLATMAVAPAAMARKPPVVDAPPVPPPPPPMPDVSMSGRFVAEAGGYDDYIHQAASISPAFTDAESVGQFGDALWAAGGELDQHPVLREGDVVGDVRERASRDRDQCPAGTEDAVDDVVGGSVGRGGGTSNCIRRHSCTMPSLSMPSTGMSS